MHHQSLALTTVGYTQWAAPFRSTAAVTLAQAKYLGGVCLHVWLARTGLQSALVLRPVVGIRLATCICARWTAVLVQLLCKKVPPSAGAPADTRPPCTSIDSLAPPPEQGRDLAQSKRPAQPQVVLRSQMAWAGRCLWQAWVTLPVARGRMGNVGAGADDCQEC